MLGAKIDVDAEYHVSLLLQLMSSLRGRITLAFWWKLEWPTIIVVVVLNNCTTAHVPTIDPIFSFDIHQRPSSICRATIEINSIDPSH
jgi:hypothetical protein